MCSSISILADNVTEFEEDFIVELALVTVGESLRLGNNATAITHIDDDGNQLETKLSNCVSILIVKFPLSCHLHGTYSSYCC